MQLFELGLQYESKANDLLCHIHKLNKTAKELQGNDLIIMKRRILSLYSDCAECRRQAALLMNYRKEETYDQKHIQP